MRRAIFIAILSTTFWIMAAAGHPVQALGAGLKTTFVKVSLKNLRIGSTYNIREMANLPLAVYNTGDSPVGVRVEPTVPIAGETREGYEPIPDPAWISFKQDYFEGIEPQRPAMTDVVISIPDNEQYLGKKYQAMIWSHTVGEGLIACGLKSEVLFTVSSERTAPPRTIGLLPTEMIIPNVEAGKPFSMKEEGSGATLRVLNPFDEDKIVIVKSIPVRSSPFHLREGYLECPDPQILELSADAVTVPRDGHQSIEVTLRFPEDDQMKGKQYMFAIAATEAGSSMPVSYSAVYVTVK